MRVGFRTRFFLAAMVPVLLAAVALDLVLGRLTEEAAADDAAAALDRLLAVAAPAVRDLAVADRAAAHRFAEELGRAAAVRVTVVRPDGVVAADSEVEAARVPALPNHGGRPEIRAAFAGGEGRATRYSETRATPLLYRARRMEAQDGLAVLRLSVPMVGIEQENARTQRVLLAVTAAAVLLLALGIWTVSALLSRRLRRLAELAARMADGELDRRVEDPTGDELSRLADALNRLAASNQATFGRLEAEGRRVRAIVDAMREGVLAVGPDGRITAANRALLALAGHEGDPVGRRPAELLRVPEILAAVDAALAGRATSEEIAVAHPRPATLIVAAVPLEADRGAVVVLHDTTELQRVERVRRDFVANVSHELRNPVATVQAAAETLGDLLADDADPDRRRLAESIERNAGRLATLVRDLLDLARLDAGQFRVEPAPNDLGPLLAAAVAAAADRAQAKGLALTSRVAPGAERARCDAAALATVLSNLLDNAIKYTRPGDAIELRARRDGAAVAIEVADTGPGIDAVHLPRLFERFYRVDAGRSRDLGGTGLGLAIVKHLVLAMGGQVAVRSAPGQGTTVAVTLPAAD